MARAFRSIHKTLLEGTGLISNDIYDTVAYVQNEDVDEILETIVLAPSPKSLPEILNVESNDCLEMLDNESLKETVVWNVTLNETTFDFGDDTDEEEARPGFQERRQFIDFTMHLILEEEEPDFAVLKYLQRSGGNINHHERRTSQSTLDSFFCKQ